MHWGVYRRLLAIVQERVRGQGQEQEMARAAAHDVFGLLPEERPLLELRQVRPDQGRA